MLVLFAARVLPSVVAARRSAIRAHDRLAWLLALTVERLPPGRSEWGRAMESELAHLHGRRQRWSFGIGCVVTASRLRARAALLEPDRGGRTLRSATLATVGASFALLGYGLYRYPGLASGPSGWAALAAFAVVLCAYAVSALTLTRGRAPELARARRSGLIGGLAIGAAWLMVMAPTDAVKAFVALPLAAALLGPALLAGIVGRMTRSARTATHAACWSGLVGGLLAFIVWVVAAYRGAGGPYDPQLLRDFHRSGTTDLATYAVGDDLGAGMSLLVLIPTVAYALGSLGARLAASPSGSNG